MKTPSKYLPNERYAALIDSLAAAHEAHDPKTRITELVGEFANVWPESVLEDEDAEPSVGERVVVQMLFLSDMVADHPKLFADPALRHELVGDLMLGCLEVGEVEQRRICKLVELHSRATELSAAQHASPGAKLSAQMIEMIKEAAERHPASEEGEIA